MHKHMLTFLNEIRIISDGLGTWNMGFDYLKCHGKSEHAF